MNTKTDHTLKSTTSKPIRKAILLGAPGTWRTWPPGVENDLVNVSDYLQSPRGGARDANEIEIYNNPSTWQLKYAITNGIADYLIIYFSGHGFQDGQKAAAKIQRANCQRQREHHF